MVLLCARVSKELAKKVRIICAVREISLQEALTEMIKDFIKKHPLKGEFKA